MMTFFSVTRLLTRTIYPKGDFSDFKNVFMEALEKAKLLAKQGDKLCVIDVAHREEKSDRVKKMGADAAVKVGETCFVMQPFASPHGDYYEKIFKPSSRKLNCSQ